ncbi:10358_t:CDS:2, partial [Gigaspora rosea]
AIGLICESNGIEKDGKVYVEISIWRKNKKKALELAKKATHNYPT